MPEMVPAKNKVSAQVSVYTYCITYTHRMTYRHIQGYMGLQDLRSFHTLTYMYAHKDLQRWIGNF